MRRLLFGAAIGAGLMYLFDPDRGKGRRARLSDQTAATLRRARREAEGRAADLENRAQGLQAEMSARGERARVSDEVLVARVRSEIGRVVAHPGSIEVQAGNGWVALSGPVLRHEAGALLAAVRAVPGVQEVEDRLTVHDRADGIPGLQEGRPARA
jgi:hypothetical protein